jgi:DNA-binding transcriptional MocR family regulator
MITNNPAADLAGQIDERSARGIAAAVGRLITSGHLAVGVRLPTVRELSRSLGVSPTTVSEAWQTLASVGALDARGRRGTFVRQPTGPDSPIRYRMVSASPANGRPGQFALDLATGTPHPDLLPDLGPAIAKVSRQSLTSSYLDTPVLPELDELLRASWPFPPEELTVVDGALDALDRVARVIIRLGDRVAVEHPTFPPLLDLLERLGADVIGIDVDAEGLAVEGVRAAVQRGIRAVFLQPRAQNPSGVSMSARRAKALGALLAPAATVVVEDDHAGDIATDPLVSLGSRLPTRTVHIRSYSKSHGPDLRLAAVGGAGEVVSAVANRRLLGPGWSSRILQAVLVEMLCNQATTDAVGVARREYARRREVVTGVLAERNVAWTGSDGINLWMRVNDERDALVTLATQGIGAAPGEPFLVRADDDHLRVTVGLIDHDIEQIAGKLADAAGHPPRRTGHR